MNRNWSVSHHKDGDHVHIYEYRLRTKLLTLLEEAVETVDAKVTRHWLCASGLPEAFWKIPVGRAQYDPEDPDFLENSVGSKVYDLYNRFSGFVYRAQKQDEVASIPITQEQLLELVPDWGFLFEDDED